MLPGLLPAESKASHKRSLPALRPAAAVGQFPPTVDSILDSLGHSHYSERLKEDGFDTVARLSLSAMDDLKSVGVKPGHAREIMAAAAAAIVCATGAISPVGQHATQAQFRLTQGTDEKCTLVEQMSLPDQLNDLRAKLQRVLNAVKPSDAPEEIEAELNSQCVAGLGNIPWTCCMVSLAVPHTID